MQAPERWIHSSQPTRHVVLPWVVSGLLLMCVILVWPDGTLDAWRAQVRATARTSWLLFMGVFLSAGGRAAMPEGQPLWQAWLMRHRAALASCFLVSHGLHAIGIAMLAVVGTPEEWARLTPIASRWIGGVGYAAIAVWLLWQMRRQATGWRVPDAAARWALGLVWAVFWLACAKRVPMQPLYALPALAMLAALWWRWRLQRRHAGEVMPLTPAG